MTMRCLAIPNEKAAAGSNRGGLIFVFTTTTIFTQMDEEYVLYRDDRIRRNPR